MPDFVTQPEIPPASRWALAGHSAGPAAALYKR